MNRIRFKTRAHKSIPTKNASLSEMLAWAKKELAFLGPEEAQADAEWLLADLTGLNRSGLYLQAHKELSESEVRVFEDQIHNRKKRIPVAYILGKAFFRDEFLEVSPACLIPRPETEQLVDCFIENSGFTPKDEFAFLDLGSGSGAIGVSVLKNFPKARGVFSDISNNALEMTRRNLTRYGLLERSRIVLSDLFEQLRQERWEVIFSNPPYVANTVWPTLEPEVQCEPKVALDGGKEGIEIYSRIAKQAAAYLRQNGQLLLEIGIHQAAPVAELLQRSGFSDMRIYKDYQGIERVLTARI